MLFLEMNVETKMQLMNEYESYWDMLPPEVQDYINELKRNQEKIDQDNKDLMNSLCQEIKLYVALKKAWGLGSIKWKVDRSKTHPYTQLNGHYKDQENVKQVMFLGYGYQQALARVNHVKSFL